MNKYNIFNEEVFFYTNTSPTGCISHAIVKTHNYYWNSTLYEYELTNINSAINVTNPNEIKNLYNDVGAYTVNNEQQLLLTGNGINNITILQNQTLLCK